MSTQVMGTHGYAAPEYVATGLFNVYVEYNWSLTLLFWIFNSVRSLCYWMCCFWKELDLMVIEGIVLLVLHLHLSRT